jgi:hypothetical protein
MVTMPDQLKVAVERFVQEALKVSKLFGLRIDGIEVTQSTQHYRASDHLTDPSDRGADNSIALIAGKSALVRVYLRNYAGPLSGVTGRLTVEASNWLSDWRVIATPSPLPPATTTAWPDPGYAFERGNLSSTLNFRIPGSLVGGRMRFSVEIRSADGADKDSMTIEVAASVRQTLRIRGIPISYQGPDASGNPVTLARPTVAQFATTAATAVAMFPVEDQPNITLTGDFNWFAPLTGAPLPTDPGGCAPSWNALLYWLNLMKSADGNRADLIYYGLVPAGVPTGFNTGCGGQGGVGAGLVGDTAAFAHECGHVAGFGHAPCNLTTGDPNDPNYPAYEPYDAPTARLASIGEYGVDLRNNAVASPAMTTDFMSYCGPQWIGPYHYRALLNHWLFNPRRIVERGPKLPDWVHDQIIPELDLPRPGPVELEIPTSRYRSNPAQRLLMITGLMRRGEFERVTVLRVAARAVAAGRSLPGTTVEFRNAQGAVLDRVRLRRVPLFASGCGCGGGHDAWEDEPGLESGLVEACLPDRDDIQSVVISRDDTVLWAREALEELPSFEALSAEVTDSELRLQWYVRGATDDTHYVVRWSHDQGGEWEVLTMLPASPERQSSDETQANLSLESLRSGDSLVQVLAIQDLHTVASDPIAITIPDRPPGVAILWPREGSVVPHGEPVRLWGMALSASGDRLPEAALSWTLDGRPAGNGSVSEAELGDWEGEHRAILHVRGETGDAEAGVTFFVTCSGEPPVRYHPQ